MSLIDVGKPIRLGEHSDTDGKVSNRAECRLTKCKIYPVKFQLSYADLFDNTPGPSIKYNYGEAIADLGKKFASVGLGGSGVRCWVNDSTSGSMSVTNNLKDNVMVEKVNNANSISGMAMLDSIRNAVKSSGGSMPNPAPNSAVLNVFLEGKHLSLPQIWESTSYDNNINFSVLLLTPYGSKRAVMEHIIKPMAALYCMGAGMSYDGITYGNPGYVTAIAPGLGFVQLGSLNVSSSPSSGEEEKNIYGQSLSIPLSFTVTSAIRGFAASVNGDIATVGDGMSPASPTNSGLAINTPGSIINALRPGDSCNAAMNFSSSSFGAGGGSSGPGGGNFNINGINQPAPNSSDASSSGNYSMPEFNEFMQQLTPDVKRDPVYSNLRRSADDFSKKINDANSRL